jgi:rare lipoprotein A
VWLVIDTPGVKMNATSKIVLVLACSATFLLAGCTSDGTRARKNSMFNSKGESLAGFAGTGSAYFKGSGPVPKGGGKFHVGKPYQVAGRWYYPKAQPGYDKQGTASWYGEAFHRRKTSNGEYFDMNMLTAAHPTLPLPSYAKVTNLENGKSVVVRINDRGPFVGTRIIDLSKRAADDLEFRNSGKADVRVQWLGNAPLNDNGTHLAMMNRKLAKGSGLKYLVASTEIDPGEERKSQIRQDSAARQQLVSESSNENLSDVEGYLVKVGTFGDVGNARAVYDQVASYGLAQMIEVNAESGALYRVQLGPFRSKLSAQEALYSLQNEGFPDAIVTKARFVVAENAL